MITVKEVHIEEMETTSPDRHDFLTNIPLENEALRVSNHLRPELFFDLEIFLKINRRNLDRLPTKLIEILKKFSEIAELTGVNVSSVDRKAMLSIYKTERFPWSIVSKKILSIIASEM